MMVTTPTLAEREAYAGFGRRVRMARIGRRMSQARLGELVGGEAGYICRIENGLRTCPLHIMLRISVALGFSLDEVFDIPRAPAAPPEGGGDGDAD